MPVIESFENETAEIFGEDGELIGSVMVDLYVVQERILKSWHGSFQQPKGFPFLPLGAIYKIKLPNGKTGEFFVKSMNMNSSGFALFTFKGTGPLA